jgi:hypothetical protein
MCVLKNPRSQPKHKINRHLPFKHLHHLKKRAMINREMKKIKTRKMIKKYRVKDRHTQESTKRFKEITP